MPVKEWDGFWKDDVDRIIEKFDEPQIFERQLWHSDDKGVTNTSRPANEQYFYVVSPSFEGPSLSETVRMNDCFELLYATRVKKINEVYGKKFFIISQLKNPNPETRRTLENELDKWDNCYILEDREQAITDAKKMAEKYRQKRIEITPALQDRS
ncbi:hypothetical protein GOV11_03400 [Candidatus Woesearchaeota archaeon]|nr:hypothetical protein [Candidatus Woesearchaeota archaeon]